MPRVRTNFSDRQKAEIFARDRATCCFSGANLWLLESPLRPGWQMDWVDHIKPSAKGGKSDLSNGVCASHLFNAKKRHNSADSYYLFAHGKPTDIYHEIFGPLPTGQMKRLTRLQALVPTDWYFNRAIANAYLGFDWRCYKARYKDADKRDDTYWFKAGYRKLQIFLRKSDRASLEARGLTSALKAREWLQLCEGGAYDRVVQLFASIFPSYQRNYNAWASYFWDATSDTERSRALEVAMKNDADPEIIDCIIQQQDLSIPADD